MQKSFHSFAEAFEEASRKQGIEYFEPSLAKAMLDQVRRQFRLFLDALAIEYSALKAPKEIMGYSESLKQKDKKEQARKEKEDRKAKRRGDVLEEKSDEEDFSSPNKLPVIDQYMNYCKNIPYSFNDDGFNMAVDFICNWKNSEYKYMRKCKFSIENKLKYQDIISAVKSNMLELGYSEDVIFMQECMFWHNIASHTKCSVIDFLDIKPLLWHGKPEDLISNLSIAEEEDIIYVSSIICQDYLKFQEKWITRIEKMLQMRKHYEQSSINAEGEKLISAITQRIRSSSDSASGEDNAISRVDLKYQRLADERDVNALRTISDLVRSIVCSGAVPQLPDIPKSSELYKQVISQENINAEETNLLKE